MTELEYVRIELPNIQTARNTHNITTMIRNRKYRNVLIYGNVKHTGDNFLFDCPSIENIKFDLPLTTIIGRNFMEGCYNLINVDFTGLPNLTRISCGFMSYCNNLKNPNFTGLSNLITIGEYFMHECNSLVNPNFTGLTNVISIGSGFMFRCYKLANPNFTGLTNLRQIGNYFMSDCRNVVNPNFTGLENLTYIGKEFMTHCKIIEIPYDDKIYRHHDVDKLRQKLMTKYVDDILYPRFISEKGVVDIIRDYVAK